MARVWLADTELVVGATGNVGTVGVGSFDRRAAERLARAMNRAGSRLKCAQRRQVCNHGAKEMPEIAPSAVSRRHTVWSQGAVRVACNSW